MFVSISEQKNEGFDRNKARHKNISFILIVSRLFKYMFLRYSGKQCFEKKNIRNGRVKMKNITVFKNTVLKSYLV